MHETRRLFVATLAIAFALAGIPSAALGASAEEIRHDSEAALSRLYASTPAAKALGAKAKGILIFPHILKAGFIVGGQGGDGALQRGGKTVAYYRNIAASYGFQAGAEEFSYVLFLMTDSAVEYLDKSDGWELGTGPTLVVVDKGMAKSLSTTTLKKDVYAFIFGQEGLMAGLSIEGSKITRIHPE